MPWGRQSGEPARAVWGWAAAGVTVVFIAITCWWLSADAGIPFADAGSHLFTAIVYHDLLEQGPFIELWRRAGYYPPLTFVVGGVAALIGGVNDASPVIGENLVYVPLLALGCNGVGRRLAGPQAGFLAVIFALGSPLLIEQFHVFMIDAPQAALVAVTVWLILETDRFGRPGRSALAGILAGLALNAKEQSVLFLVGVIAVVLIRGGWRNWRGLAIFGAVALAIGSPWYLINWEQLALFAKAAGPAENLPPRGRPPLVSISNFGWYLWAVMNGVLFAPLFAFAAVGTSRAALAVARARSRPLASADVRPELLGGMLVGWLGLTLTPHHDMRYAMSLIIFLATLGSSWIVELKPIRRHIAIALLAGAVVATTIGATFGVGGELRIPLARHLVVTDTSWGIPPPNQLTVYADHDFVISGPRDGTVLELFRAIKREGFTGVGWVHEQALVGTPTFDLQGLELFARFVGLSAPPLDLAEPWSLGDRGHVLLVRALPMKGRPPCVTLSDGTAVWMLIRGGTANHCPRM